MNHNLLILGGTTEASRLAGAVATAGIPATLSYAGRTAHPRAQPIAHRSGGFGGIAGLKAYLAQHGITHVVDATHPFAAQMSRHALAACREANVPLLALTRPPWHPQPGDHWQTVADVAAAVRALDGPPARVFLAIGRQNLADFAAQPQHHYLSRLVDPPAEPPPLPHHTVVVARGPFTPAGDTELMRAHAITTLVAKNAGGDGASAKLEAARSLAIPVIMIARPELPARREVHAVDAVLHWLAHDATDLGV